MNVESISKYSSISDLRTQITKDIEHVEKDIDTYSTLLGDKIRENQTQEDDPDFIAFKERLEGPTDDKKKKRPSKKNQNKNWYDLDGILIYNGVGIKGELELYFKGIEELKSNLENLNVTKRKLDMIIENGLKEDLGCVVFRKDGKPLEIALLKNTHTREKFSFKSTYHVKPSELESPIELEN